MPSLPKKLQRILPEKLNKFFAKLTRSRNLAIIFAIASVISVVATYFAIAQSHTPAGPEPSEVLTLIIIDLILLLSLAVLIAKQLFKLIIQRRKGITGSRLQTRIVLMFSLVAMVPTIIMVISSAVFFNYGIQSWFNDKVGDAIDGSVEIARSYLAEHKNVIGADVIGMANDINRDALNLRVKPGSFNKKLSFLAAIRKLPEALVFQKVGYGKVTILAATNLSFSLQLELEGLSKEAITKASKGELVILTSDSEDRVIALTRLDNFFDTYLLVGRFVDNKIISHIEATRGAATE